MIKPHSSVRLSSHLLILASSVFAAPLLAQAAPDPQPGAQTRPAMSAQDLVTLPRLGGVVTSRDGRFAVYRVTKTDGETLARTGEYQLLDLENPAKGAVSLDLGESVFDAQFGGDGWLYFLSTRAAADGDESGEVRLWRAELDAAGNITGPMVVAMSSGAPIEGYSLSPDASKLAVWSEIARDCPQFGCDDDGTQHLPGPGTGRLYDGKDGFVRHWDHWISPGSYGRVFVFDLDRSSPVNLGAAAGIALDGVASTSDLTGHTPTRPFGGGEDVAWAPDGSGVYFTARQAGADEPMSTNFDIWWSDLGGGAPTNLTAGNAALDTAPTPSPDGKWLAYLAMERPNYESDQLVIHLRNVRSGKTRALTKGFDRSFGSLAWTPDSRSIIATAQDLLDTPAFKIDRRSGAVEKLDLIAGHEAHLANVQVLPRGKMLFTRDSIGHPAELYLARGMRTAQPLTDIARSELGTRSAIAVRRFSFAGAGGDLPSRKAIMASFRQSSTSMAGRKAAFQTVGLRGGTRASSPAKAMPLSRSISTAVPDTAKPSPMRSTAIGAESRWRICKKASPLRSNLIHKSTAKGPARWARLMAAT
jgi:dipeptidyl aminopeptidase/acylaminoacyl peptidase